MSQESAVRKPSMSIPDDGQRTPLVEFSGVLKRYAMVDIPGTNGRNARTQVIFDFTDVVVIEATEPYNFPIATIPLPYNLRKGTAWDFFCGSAKKTLPQEDIDLLVGKVQRWRYADVQMRRPVQDENGVTQQDATGKDIWALQPAHAWQVQEVEGYSSTNSSGQNITDMVVAQIGTGKTDEEILLYIYQDKDLKGMPGYEELVEAAASRNLLPALEKAGRIASDGAGKWKVS